MSKRRLFSPEEEAEIRRLYPHYPTQLVADELGRSARSVYAKANSMGLYKSEAFKEQERQRASKRLEIAGVSHRFQKGQKAHNKGRRMAPEVRAKCAPTMFKKGSMSGAAQHNYKPIGSTRIVYGNLERKISDDPNVYPARRWAPVHRIVWEAAHGPVPAGHVVVFKPGRHTSVEGEITLDRLECITRTENMRRNSVHNYPEPIKRVLRAKARLNREINKRQRA